MLFIQTRKKDNADDQTGGDQNGGHKSGLSENSTYPKEAFPLSFRIIGVLLYMVLSIPVEKDKDLNSYFEWQIDAFGNGCLCRIMGYRWYDFVPNQRLLCETDSAPITWIVYQCQLRPCRHVAHYPEADPAHQVVSVRDNPEWRRPRGRP